MFLKITELMEIAICSIKLATGIILTQEFELKKFHSSKISKPDPYK